MAAEALAPCVTMSSANVVLNIQEKQVFVFHKGWFPLPLPSQPVNDRKYSYVQWYVHIF